MKMKEEANFKEIQALEESLWKSETRFDNAYMETIFAEDFIEFGQSGKVYSRPDIFFDETSFYQIAATLPLPQFRARFLANDLGRFMVR